MVTAQGNNSATLAHNKELSAIFTRMAECYQFLGPAERFRAIAYETAARTLGNMSEPVDVYDNDIRALDQLKGVGESIAEKIIEYLHTGKIRKFEELKKRVPYRLIGLMDIKSIGPSTIRLLYEELGIEDRDALVKALESGRLSGLKGFGEKRVAQLKKALKFDDEKKRMPLAEAERIGNTVLGLIRELPGVRRAELAGSIRRKKDTIGDIDIVIVAHRKDWRKIINRFVKLPLVSEVIVQGETKASVVLRENRVQTDLRLVHDYEFGSAMFYFTGSKEHNIKLRTIARQKGWKINEYGVFDAKGKRLAGETEEGIYALFGLKFIPPGMRLGKNEFSDYQLNKKK